MKFFKAIAAVAITTMLSACGSDDTIKEPNIESLFSCGQFLEGNAQNPFEAAKYLANSMRIINRELDEDREIHRWYKAQVIADTGSSSSAVYIAIRQYCEKFPSDGINDAIITAAEDVFRESHGNPMFRQCSYYNDGHFTDEDLFRQIELPAIPESMPKTAEAFAKLKQNCANRPERSLDGELQSLAHTYIREAEEQKRLREYEAGVAELQAQYLAASESVRNSLLGNGGIRCDAYATVISLLNRTRRADASIVNHAGLKASIQEAVLAHVQQSDDDLTASASRYLEDFGLPYEEACQSDSLIAFFGEHHAQLIEKQQRHDAWIAEEQAHLNRIEAESQRRAREVSTAENEMSGYLQQAREEDRRRLEEQRDYQRQIEDEINIRNNNP